MKIKPLFSLIPFFILLILMYVPALGSNISEAQRHYFEGKYNQALPYFIKAINKQPNNPMLNYFLGMTYFKLKQYQESKKVFEKVVKIKPNYELARLQLARACYETGDYAWANSRGKRFLNSQNSRIEASKPARRPLTWVPPWCVGIRLT